MLVGGGCLGSCVCEEVVYWRARLWGSVGVGVWVLLLVVAVGWGVLGFGVGCLMMLGGCVWSGW